MSVAGNEEMFNALNSALINKTRQKLKRTFSKLDDKINGQVHRDAFFHTLNHYHMILNESDKKALRRQFDNQNGYLPYNHLVKNLTLNINSQEWSIKNLTFSE
jgi:Ca2+-binding EF-hand superfamily protein